MTVHIDLGYHHIDLMGPVKLVEFLKINKNTQNTQNTAGDMVSLTLLGVIFLSQ